MYQVLARKWRPRGFNELVGQDHVARTLGNSIRANRLAHAYIFAGVRGTGKTTVARIFAKCLNCDTGPTATPCGDCVPCREIGDGRALDVLEMDAASRTGVGDIRELQEVVSYAPVRDRYKVLIIDEAHMLSKSAFNALLKTLEEPPPRVVFVLATTELPKILPTILSRCQLFEFRRVGPRELTAHLRKVCASEDLQVSDAMLDRIARAGEGSVRDSLSLLERVVAFAGASVSEDDALQVLGAVRVQVLAELLRALARRDAAGMLAVLDGLASEGHDLLHVWSEAVAAIRDLLLLRAAPERADLLSRSPEDAAVISAAAEGLGREDLTRVFQILVELEFGLKGSSQPRFLFEAAMIRLADLGSVRPIEEILRSLGTGVAPASAVQGAPRRPDPPVSPAPAAPQKKKAAETPAPSPAAPDPPARPAPAEVEPRFRALVHEARPMLDAMLDQARALALQAGVLRVSYPARLESIRRQIERPENRAVLIDALRRAAGENVELRVVVDEEAPTAAAAAPEPGPGSAAPIAAARPGATDTLLDSARKDPGVAKLLLEFGAEVVDIRAPEADGEPIPAAETPGQVEEPS